AVRIGGRTLSRGTAAVTRTIAFAIPLLELHDLQGLRVDLRLEVKTIGVRAADLIAAVVDLDPLHFPATGRGHPTQVLAGLPLLYRSVAVVGEHGSGCEADRQGQQTSAQDAVDTHDRVPLQCARRRSWLS